MEIIQSSTFDYVIIDEEGRECFRGAKRECEKEIKKNKTTWDYITQEYPPEDTEAVTAIGEVDAVEGEKKSWISRVFGL